MIKLEKLVEGLGPVTKARVEALATELANAREEVAKLEALRTQRLAEQPAQAVFAGTDPRALAADLALAGALTNVLAQINADLATAKQRELTAAAPYNKMVEFIQRRRGAVAQLNEEIRLLTMERDKLQKDLTT